MKIEKVIPKKVFPPQPKYRLLFHLLRGGGLLLIHIFPIFLTTYFLINYSLLTKFILYLILSIFNKDIRIYALIYGEKLFLPLAIYLFAMLLIWALIIWPVVRKYFPPLYLDTDGVQYKEGRVWWASPNRYTKLLKTLAGKGGVDYKEEKYFLYRCGKLLNPLKPLKSVNKLYFAKGVEKYVEILPNRIIFHNLLILKYKDGYILMKGELKSEDIDIAHLNKRIHEDSKRISTTVGNYALINPDLRIKNVSSTMFWVPPSNLEIREHINVGDETIGFEILGKLVDDYDKAKEKAMKDGVITPQETSTLLLPHFNEILKYANSIKAKFANTLLPDPPESKTGLISYEMMESYINEIKSALRTYSNPEVFR